MGTKLYLFYKDKDLYAMTTNEELARTFEIQRKKGCFYKKEVRATSEQLKACSYVNRNCMLFSNILTDGKNDYYMVTTYSENDLLEDYCDRIYDEILKLESELYSIPWESEIYDTISAISECRKKSEESEKGTFNSFNIFMMLFGDTVL